MSVTFNRTVFDPLDINSAKRIILTPDGGTSEQRWIRETPYLADLVGQLLRPTRDTVLLDYGCGIGRVAKELIDRHRCRIVGLDISPRMRDLAQFYVQSDRFSTCSPEALALMIRKGAIFDGAICIWVLQHCAQPTADIAQIRRGLKPNAKLFVVNHRMRRMPTVEHGWTDDGINVKELLKTQFALQREGRLSPAFVNDTVSRFSFWALFCRLANRMNKPGSAWIRAFLEQTNAIPTLQK